MTLRASYSDTSSSYTVSDGVHRIDGLTLDEFLEFHDALSSGRHTADYLFRTLTARHRLAGAQ